MFHSKNFITITHLELHLLELKYNSFIFIFTFLYLFLICYYFSNQLIYLSVQILVQYDMLKYLIFTSVTEIFVTNFWIALFISCFISSQLFILQFWFFISKGLYKYENFNFIKIYIIYLIINIWVILTIFYKIIPTIWFFFFNLAYSNPNLFTIYFEPKLSTYFYFIFFSFICLYTIFLYFFFFFYIIIKKFLKIEILLYLRKIFYFQFLIISILISPPDLLYQLLIFFYFIIFFEILIIFYLFIFQYFNHY